MQPRARHIAASLAVALPLVLVAGCAFTRPAVGTHDLPQAVAGDGPLAHVTGPVDQAPAPRPVTIVLSGDVLIHNTIWQAAGVTASRRGETAAFDFRPMLAPLRSIVHGADLAICHLEMPLAPRDGPYSNFPRFAAPREIVPALAWAGYDACSTGSNHSVDQGEAGLVRTLDVLDQVGLRHTGTSRTKREARQPVIFDVNGLRVGWLEYTYGTNGLPVDPAKPWSVNLIDVHRILRDAHRARAQGAEAVIVGLHWGNEYQTTPSEYQTQLARRLAHSPDITLIYGHHAHVVQPIEKVHGTWVVYGLGNLLADQGDTAPGDDHGLVLKVTLTQAADGRVSVSKLVAVPTWIDASAGFKVRPLGPGRLY